MARPSLPLRAASGRLPARAIEWCRGARRGRAERSHERHKGRRSLPAGAYHRDVLGVPGPSLNPGLGDGDGPGLRCEGTGTAPAVRGLMVGTFSLGARAEGWSWAHLGPAVCALGEQALAVGLRERPLGVFAGGTGSLCPHLHRDRGFCQSPIDARQPVLGYPGSHPAWGPAPRAQPRDSVGTLDLWVLPYFKHFLLFQSERPSCSAPSLCPLAVGAEVAVAEGASREMEALCSELLLPTPGEAGAVGSPGVASTSLAGTPPLTASQDLLLAEASVPGEGAPAEGNDVEIFIEAVAGNMTVSNTINATGMGCREGSVSPLTPSGGRDGQPQYPGDTTVPLCL